MDEDKVLMPPMYKLTTMDNPYHPVDERENWERYDRDKGYNCDALVWQIAGFSNQEEEAEIRRAENDAIDFIIAHDLECIYKKVLIED